MESVRGYKESAASGDQAVHVTVETSFPNPLEKIAAIGKSFQMVPFLFYDLAELTIQEPLPLPGQGRSAKLEGAGAGVRGSMAKHLEYEFDWAIALNGTDRTKNGQQQFYFKLRAVF
jgi:hemolysin activation/secretion protein